MTPPPCNRHERRAAANQSARTYCLDEEIWNGIHDGKYDSAIALGVRIRDELRASGKDFDSFDWEAVDLNHVIAEIKRPRSYSVNLAMPKTERAASGLRE
jgi:hypothetical protein